MRLFFQMSAEVQKQRTRWPNRSSQIGTPACANSLNEKYVAPSKLNKAQPENIGHCISEGQTNLNHLLVKHLTRTYMLPSGSGSPASEIGASIGRKAPRPTRPSMKGTWGCCSTWPRGSWVGAMERAERVE